MNLKKNFKDYLFFSSNEVGCVQSELGGNAIKVCVFITPLMACNFFITHDVTI